MKPSDKEGDGMAMKLSERGPIYQERCDALSAQAGPYHVNITNEVAQLEGENGALKRGIKHIRKQTTEIAIAQMCNILLGETA